MTCIVGMVEKKRVYLGADSVGSNGWDLMARIDKKICRNGNMIFGFTSSYRMSQVLQYKFVPPVHSREVTTDYYMRTAFIDEVRKVLKDGGYSVIKDNAERGGTFLVGYCGRLFEVEGDFQVAERADKYSSVGCGSRHALASLHTTRRLGLSVRKRLVLALQAAEYFSEGVRRPFHFLESE